MKHQLIALLVVALITICPEIARGQHPLPYLGYESGINVQEDFTFPCLTIGIQAQGWATQVGNYDGEGTIMIDVVTGEVLLAQYTSTDRNGNQLYADLESTVINDTTLLVEGTITGGTGRFAGASGEYLFLLKYDQPSSVLPNTYDGIFAGHIWR